MSRKKKQLIIGRQPSIEALKSGQTVEKVFLQRDASGYAIDQIKQLCRELDVPLSKVPRVKLDNMTQNNHQGVMAFLSELQYQELSDVVSHCYEQGKMPLLVGVDGVTDVRNIGAIARSIEVLGGQALIIPTHGSASLNEAAIKSSAGALIMLNVCRVRSLETTIIELKKNGVQIVGSSLTGKTPPQDIDFTLPTFILLGSEDMGVDDKLLKLLDHNTKIPQMGKIDSLNVSVSAGIIMYEAMKQRIADLDS